MTSKAAKWKSCFDCDGSGQICDRCGESEARCTGGCDGDEPPTYTDCETCKGEGRVDVNAEED